MHRQADDNRRRPIDPQRLNLGAEVGRRQSSSRGADERIAKRTRVQRRRYLKRSLIIAAGLALAWQLLSPVQQIKVVGADELVVRGALEAAFTELPRRNLLIEGDVLAAKLTRTIPDAVGVTVEHNLLLSRLSINVTNQTPALRWQSRGVQYRLSDHGFVLALADETDAALPVVFDEANLDVTQKDQIVPRDFVTFVRQFDSAATARQLAVVDRFVSGSTREMRVTLADKAYALRLSTLRSADTQLDELARLERYFSQVGKRAREYVDLRIPGRAYWR